MNLISSIRSPFDSTSLGIEALLGGRSALDFKQLPKFDESQVRDFIKNYGFDLNDAEDTDQIQRLFRRAISYIESELLHPGEILPEMLTKADTGFHVEELLLCACGKSARLDRMWACAVLRVIHVLVHLENDLFTTFSTEIQAQIVEPLTQRIVSDGKGGLALSSADGSPQVPIKKFETKPFKSSYSALTKLLAKPEVLAFTLLDKIGVRFVTHHLVDVFRVMQFLVEENLISFPHNIPDQSVNTLYPFNLYAEVLENLERTSETLKKRALNGFELDELLSERLRKNEERAEFVEKPNAFSSGAHRFVKFISRRRIKVEGSERHGSLSFFYPFEVQIVDAASFAATNSGEASHEEYKSRQRAQARLRVFGGLTDLRHG